MSRNSSHAAKEGSNVISRLAAIFKFFPQLSTEKYPEIVTYNLDREFRKRTLKSCAITVPGNVTLQRSSDGSWAELPLTPYF